MLGVVICQTFSTEGCDVNCTFSEDFITSENLKLFPTNCSIVCANIVLDQNSNVTEKQLTLAFKNMRTLYGSLKVQTTTFTSGKFLGGLEAIECDTDGFFTWEDNSHLTEIGMTNLSKCACNIDINFNVKQTSLSLPSLKIFSSITSKISQYTVSINSMPSEFCITTDEMENFMGNENVEIQFDEINYCNSTTREKLCLTDRFSFTKLEIGCTRVLGYIKITDVLKADIEKLKTVKWIFGTLDIDSTVLVSIDFLDSLEYVVSLEPDYYAIKIVNNKKLMNISLPNIKRVRTNYESWVEFYENPENLTKVILENTPFCKNKDKPYYDKTRIDGRTCDPRCIFNEESITFENSKNFPTNCSVVCSYLQIDEKSNLSENQLSVLFKSVKTLFGSLRVYKTKLTTMKFLTALEVIECDETLTLTVEENEELTELGMVNLTRCTCEFIINLNHKMMKLNLPNLKNFSSLTSNISQYEIYINNLHPDFCIDISEMENSIKNRNLFMKQLPEKYCNVPHSGNYSSGEKLCDIRNSSLSKLESGCVKILGDILIGPGDEDQVHKLENLRILFGRIEIRETNLTRVDFLSKLEYVATLEHHTASLKTAENDNLIEILLPSLKMIRSDLQWWFQSLDGNAYESIMAQPNVCTSIRDINNETVLYFTSFGGASCEEELIDEKKNGLKPDNFELAYRGLGSFLAFVIYSVFKNLQ